MIYYYKILPSSIDVHFKKLSTTDSNASGGSQPGNNNLQLSSSLAFLLCK